MSSLFFASVFDWLMKFFPSPRSQRARAITIVLSLLVFSFGMVSVALSTHHKYLPLAVLGIIYGVLLSYPATALTGPKLQSALGGALGGFSMGNMVHKFNHTLSSIELFAQWIAAAVNIPGRRAKAFWQLPGSRRSKGLRFLWGSSIAAQ